MGRPTEILIDRQALLHNVQRVKELCPDGKIVAVIKADAYGHGSSEVAKILQDQVSMFAVSSVEEAQELRSNGIQTPVLLLEGCFTSDELHICVQQGFEVVTHNQNQVQMVEDAKLSGPLRVWLKVDTGMHRLGVMPDQVNPFFERLERSSNVHSVVLMTHLSYADGLNDPSTPAQLTCFQQVVKQLNDVGTNPFEISIANSAGILAWPKSHGQWQRPGIMLYGLTPLTEDNETSNQLIPVMIFRSQIIALRWIAAGESVGYGNTWVAQQDSHIATVAVGYGDGYPRNAKNGTPVMVRGQRCPLVGRVSMDMIAVDVTQLQEVALGDTVELWGQELSANEVATWADTIGYELVTRMPKRTPRKILD